MLGQRFFSSFPLSVIVDRVNNSYILAIGGAQITNHDKQLLIVIFVTMTIVVSILGLVIYKMISIRKRRLEADEWLVQNQAKLINYALQTKPEEAENITDVLEMSKIQSEITTGKSNIRQGMLDKIH